MRQILSFPGISIFVHTNRWAIGRLCWRRDANLLRILLKPNNLGGGEEELGALIFISGGGRRYPAPQAFPFQCCRGPTLVGSPFLGAHGPPPPLDTHLY